jgi:hypothetical protein
MTSHPYSFDNKRFSCQMTPSRNRSGAGENSQPNVDVSQIRHGIFMWTAYNFGCADTFNTVQIPVFIGFRHLGIVFAPDWQAFGATATDAGSAQLEG